MFLDYRAHPLEALAFDDLLTVIATWLLVGCCCWAALICTAAVVEAATGGRLRATAWVGCPPALRRTVLALAGAALVASPGHAYATSSTSASSPAAGSRRSAPQQVLPVLPVPARPLGAARVGPRIVVRPGDTLWQLAAARLPATATAAHVCEQVERLHHRNRDLIGPDPDLIHPGQRLVVPHPISS